MGEAKIPDDIKIIAQFLAGQGGPSRAWQELMPQAFKLRRELKQRGGYRLARDSGPPEVRVPGNGCRRDP
jgi:hypothetical protein